MIVACLMAITLACCMAACGMKDKIPGTYKAFHNIEFYSDGTYTESLEYGTGTWELLDGNKLKLTNFYGEIRVTQEIEKITDEGIFFEGDGFWERID